VADGQDPPASWDVEKGVNIRWKTPIPGLADSSPVVWGDRIFVTTAVAEGAEPVFQLGYEGGSRSVEEAEKHSWRVYCLDKATGKILWEKTACEGVPKAKRQAKSSQANPTPATDGKVVVAFFGSEGLYCYDFEGNPLWKLDLGLLTAGAARNAAIQWGFASSPIIFEDVAIVQCDAQEAAFIAAYSLKDGSQVWRAPREEISAWATPTVCKGPQRAELVVNATNHICGYDPRTGEELWRLSGNSQIAIPTPFMALGLIFVASGYRPIQPIYAIRPGANGDISLAEGQESNESVAWSKQRGGPYIPTPIVYGDYLYTCQNNGTVTCYEAKTGAQVYEQRLAGDYSASPVAADGKLYFASEQGDVSVVKAGAAYELLATNSMGENCMATPAISDGALFIRARQDLFAIRTP